MDMIIKQINRAIDEFFLENGKEPEFIILSVGAYGELAYELGKMEGLDDDDAYTNEISNYKLITVAVTHNKSFNAFELR